MHFHLAIFFPIERGMNGNLSYRHGTIYHPKNINKWVVERYGTDLNPVGHLVYNKNKQVKLVVGKWGDAFWEKLPLNIKCMFIHHFSIPIGDCT